MASGLDFTAMYRASDDPWGYRSRWYEMRKRNLLLASLTRQRYATALELGCSNGETSWPIAQRAATLVACDREARAVELAAARLRGCEGVRVERRDLPGDWPAGEFDLIIINEIGYFLDPEPCRQLLQLSAQSLTPQGEVLLCHWREPIEGYLLDGTAVHAIAAEALPQSGLKVLVEHQEDDFLLAIYSRSDRSVARQEGLR